MKLHLLIGGVLILLLAMTVHAAPGVKIEKQDGHYLVQTDVYSAKVSEQAVLESLIIEQHEFIAPTEEIDFRAKKRTIPGLYAAPMNMWQLPCLPPTVKEQTTDRLCAEGNGWKLEYRFLPDAIELTWEGVPDGERGFRAAYPPTELLLHLSADIDRACDAANQGELGWPVQRPHEPGDFAFLAKDGAGFIAEGANRVMSGRFLVFNNTINDSYIETPEPLHRRLRIFRKADLAHSLTMEINAPNRQHIFSGVDAAVFSVKVNALYGYTLRGSVSFSGAPYIWKTPRVTGKTAVRLTAKSPTATVNVPIRPPHPGHYTGEIIVSAGKKPVYQQRVGFLFRPEEIPAAVPPADFDAFWDNTLAELEKIPLDMTLEEQKDQENAYGRVYKVKYRSWGGRWAWAWLNVPKAEGKFTGRVICPAVSVWQPPPPSITGGASNTLTIAVAVHGGDLKDYPAKSDFDYMNTGITSRDTYMMRYSYCCLVRCFDIIKQQEKCNGEVTIEGGSQGAGLSLVLAGMRNAKSAAGRAVALCRIDWTILGYTKWGPTCPSGADPKQVAEVVRYFDPANFAHRIHTPLRLGFGLFDFCAPAEGIFSALNALPKDTPCRIAVDPYGGHFTLNLPDFDRDSGVVEVPRWQGTDKDNKMHR